MGQNRKPRRAPTHVYRPRSDSMLTPEQALSVPKTQAVAIATLGQRWLDCAEQLTALQFKTGRSALHDCATFTRELLDARSPEHVLAVCQTAAQPLAEKADAYCRGVYEIVSNASASWGRFAGEQAVDAQKQFGAALEGALQNVPQGAGGAAAFVKQAISAATATMESVQKAAMQAAEVTDANVKAMARSGNRKAPGAAD
jgi:phasin family protein